MPDGRDREEVVRARAAAAEALRLRQRLVREVAEAERRLVAAERTAPAGDLQVERARAAHAAQVAALGDARAGLVRSVTALGEAVGVLLDPEPGAEWQALDARFPAVLLPVRIETRFGRDAAGRDELRVRVYPDTVFVDSHDEALTADEERAGRSYWSGAWAGDADAEAEAWYQLVRTLSPPRAAWVALATSPENLAERPAGQPRFPAALRRSGAWERAPHAALLPDRWLVVGQRGGAVVARATGATIREPLALGFDPHASPETEVDISGDGLALDDELAWTVDFDRAIEVGMALRVPLSADDARLGFDRVLVVGVKSSLAPEEAAGALERLLDGHHYFGGLALLAQGTPTNNTDAGDSGYPPADPDGQVSRAVERGAPLDRDGGDGSRLATALGVASATFAHVAGADGGEQERSAAMNRAVVPVTLGYFLRQLMAPHIGEATVAATLEHFVAHVRGRGPLPALRVRRQPYGILPVSSLDRWEPEASGGSFEPELVGLLRRLRPTWLAAAAKAPRVGRTSDPDADLIDVLALHPSSREVRVRPARGLVWYGNMMAYLGHDSDAILEARQRILEAMQEAMGTPGWEPRVLGFIFARRAGLYRHPLVAPPPLAETRGLDPDYVRWVRESTVAELKGEIWPGGSPPPHTLLYQVLRHARLEELARVALDLHVVHASAAVGEIRDRELVGIAGGFETPTRWERLEAPIAAVSGSLPIGDFLVQQGGGDAAADVAEHGEALAALEGVATAELDRLFSETLDVCSHRLDAWLTSLAARRLAGMREAAPTGAHLGAFGWVEDLRPAGGRPASHGHILAPSLDHATAAAVMRSGYLTRNVPGTGAYAIDLSSARVRDALELVDAVREGEPPGAVVGGRLERALREHPRRLARFIEPLRRRFPLAAGKADGEAPPPELQAVRAVVDGIALRRAFVDGALDLAHADFATGDAARDAADRTAVLAELAAMDGRIDALADLLLAESVYQAVAGSASGASATLDGMARGTVPPEPAIAGQPRSGVPIHLRVALLVGEESLPAGWPAAATPRAHAEPRLDAWLGCALGDPRRVRCRATVKPAGGPARTAVVRLADLGLRPLDLVALADATPGEGGPASEIDLRIADAARAGAAAQVTVDVARAPGQSPDDVVTFPEILEAARGLRDVIARCRPLAARDLVTPRDAEDLAAPDTDADASARAAAARGALEAAAGRLATARAGSDRAALAAALRAAALLGIPAAYPRDGDLAGQAESAAGELERRRAAASAATDPVGVATAVFGTGFPILITFAPPRPDELAHAVAASDAVSGADPARAGWLTRASRVRPALDTWRRSTLLTEALGAARLPSVVAQLPVRPGARWVALPVGEDGARPIGGTTSVMLLAAEPPVVAGRWAGLLLDEWPEVIPDAEATTAVAFHVDTPGAESPQCLLVAVPPRQAATWHVDDILAILGETLDLARIRAVDLELLGSLGQMLPATYLAANAANETVSTDFKGALVADLQLAPREG